MMYRSHLLTTCLLGLVATFSQADDALVHFDLAPTAMLVAEDPDQTLVTCELRLSSLITTASAPNIDQWIVRLQPRDSSIRITNYAPRTEVASGIDGSIEIKTTNESTQSLGVGVNGEYAKSLRGQIGADFGHKNIESRQYNKIAPLQSVTVSGTFNRGRGVYFKLRWTEQQVLEGEKIFKLTLSVPTEWRSGLIDVTVSAQSARRSFAGWDSQTKVLGAANFVVATYRAGDAIAERLAVQMASAEQRLRDLSEHHSLQPSTQSLSAMLRHVAAKLDLDSPRTHHRWLQRLINGETDPYMDHEISRLPMEVRIAAIDYHDAKNKFAQLRNDHSIADAF